MLVDKDTVGKVMVCCEFVFAEERKNLFPISLMGTTIQDGGAREKRNEQFHSFYTW